MSETAPTATTCAKLSDQHERAPAAVQDEKAPLLANTPFAFGSAPLKALDTTGLQQDSGVCREHGAASLQHGNHASFITRPNPHSDTGQRLLQLSGIPKRQGIGALAGVRTWLKVMPDGTYSVEQLERHALERELGVQLRDFRVLDAVLGSSYPACILVRSAALVVNLEHIKCIVSRGYVLLNNTEVERVKPVLDLLKERLRHSAGTHSTSGGALQCQTVQASPQPSPDVACFKACQADSQQAAGGHHNITEPSLRSGAAAAMAPAGHKGNHKGNDGVIKAGDYAEAYVGATAGRGEMLSVLPFELTVLEVCLEQLIVSFDRQASDVGLKAHKAIEQLVHRVSPSSLERIRQVKDRLAHLQKKVGATKEVLRKLLEDDRSMTYMNLTARHDAEQLLQTQKAEQQQAQAATVNQPPCPHSTQLTHSMHAHNGSNDASWHLGSSFASIGGSRKHVQHNNSLLVGRRHSLALGGLADNACELVTVRSMNAATMDQAVPSSAGPNIDDHMHMLEDGSAVVEMLLEAYFLQVDQTAGKLEACANSIHDTEAFVNIRLDQHRNYLISIDLIVSIGSLVLAACACVTGIFGMNLQSGMESKPHGMVEVSTYMLVAAAAVWGLVIWWVMSRGIIQNPWSRNG